MGALEHKLIALHTNTPFYYWGGGLGNDLVGDPTKIVLFFLMEQYTCFVMMCTVPLRLKKKKTGVGSTSISISDPYSVI